MRNLLPVMITEVLMTALLSFIILFLYDRRSETSFRQRSALTLILTMMGSMLNTLSYYLVSDKSFLNTVIAVNISMAVMSGTLLSLLWLSTTDRVDRALHRKSMITFASLLLYNEVSMGTFVYILGFGFQLSNGAYYIPLSLIRIFSLGVNTYLFIVPMLIEMCVILFLRPSRGIHRIALAALVLLSLFSPTLAGSDAFTQPGAFIVILLMIIFIPLLLNGLFDPDKKGEVQDMLWIFPVFLLMMGGVLMGVFLDSTYAFRWILYAVGMLWGMGFYFVYSFSAGCENVNSVTTKTDKV